MKCNSCGGTYDPILVDGSQYFHACPPLSPAELQTLIDAGKSPLTADQQHALDTARALDVSSPPAPGNPKRADLMAAIFAVPRPDARDENLVAGGARGSAPTIKAEGKGTTGTARSAVKG